MPLQVWVGTSGYAYPEWVGDFYPPGTSSARMLPEYARHFPLVELNYTFYRMPTGPDLANLARRTPAGFQFIVKLHQSLTHEHDLREAKAFREAVRPLAEEGRLLGLLAQYPQRFHHDRANLDQLSELAERLAGHTLAVEFRHRSWDRPDVVEWLRERSVSLVSVDVPEIPLLYPRGLVQSGRLIYVRFHSRRAESWYESDKVRYDYLYSDAEMQEWLDALAARRDSADKAVLLFNNCRRSQAAVNAIRIRELLMRMEHVFESVPPFVAAGPERSQASLF